MVVKTVFWATLCFWCALTAFFPAISILISQNAYKNSAVNAFVLANKEALLSIGTLALISFLAILQVYISNVSSEKRERSNRKTQVEMKLSEFRQAWISDLRKNASEFSALVHSNRDAEKLTRMRLLSTTILLHFDPHKEDFKKVCEIMSEFLHASKRGDGSIVSKASDFDLEIARILDVEWEKMKAELVRAQSQLEVAP